MTEHEDLIARLRNSSGVATADVNERVALMDEAADVLEKVTAEVLVEGSFFPSEELPVVLGNYIRAADENAREAKKWMLRAERAEARIEKAEDYVTRHYLDTTVGERILAALTEGDEQ